MSTTNEFDWIGVSLTSSGSGIPFGADERIGAVVRVGVRMPDTVREIEIPVLFEKAGKLTIAEARDAAIVKAVELLQYVVRELDGQTYDQLAERQNSQDEQREKEQEESLRSQLFGGKAEDT